MSLSLVSAGVDTIPANFLQGIAILTNPKGKQLQAAIYDDLIRIYRTSEAAWAAVVIEEKIPLISAFVKETLRYYTVIAMSMPRVSVTPITYQDVTIPAGTTFYMNARSANFDPSRFPFPHEFKPDRYLQRSSEVPLQNPELNQYTNSRIKRFPMARSLTVLLERELECALAFNLPTENYMSHSPA